MPTTDRSHGIADPVSKLQVDTLDENCDSYGITQFKMNDLRQGIVHIIGPEQGATLPGMTIVCGDSHTSRMARSARWRMASARRKWSTCSPRKRSFRRRARTCS